MKADTTNLKRAGIAVAGIAVIIGAVLAAARCSQPATIADPVDTLADINAAAAGLDAIAAWDPHADRRPLLVAIRATALDSDARIVAARLASGEVVEIAVTVDPDTGAWSAQNRPQPGPEADRNRSVTLPGLDTGPPRPDDRTYDAATAAWRWLQARLTGDTTLAAIIAAPSYDPPPPSTTFEAVTLGGVTAPVELPEHQIAFFGFDFATADYHGRERSWRSWVAVRKASGEWVVEGHVPLEPVPPTPAA